MPSIEAKAENTEGCRLVVIGIDSLRIDYARILREIGLPALESLNRPVCATCGGLSRTQPGWASIWTGLPSELINCYDNTIFGGMPYRETPEGSVRCDYHIMSHLIEMYKDQDFYIGWVTGKGYNIKGDIPESPHWDVCDAIKNKKHSGRYYGDHGRSTENVYDLGSKVLAEAQQHDNFIVFIHFGEPDGTGHRAVNERWPYHWPAYMDVAVDVLGRVFDLMGGLDCDVDIIACSDHGFGFKLADDWNGYHHRPDARNHHQFEPFGFVSTNFPIKEYRHVSQMSIGRLIYDRAGGNPDLVKVPCQWTTYRMYGERLALWH